MTLASGTRLGPYEIASLIGAGGMGAVYRARDTRLDRTVAVKVLLAHLAGRTDLRERFEREARTIANLNHPHICVLYDVGRQDGVDYLVMEYLDGEPLSQRLRKGPLPLEDVLLYAAQIADALDKAHAIGVTHRDLKPGNIMLTKSGTKLLDFGLAKLKQDATRPPVPVSQLPTLTNLPTAHGTVVGTLQYMAPEQLEGREVDARTDIFAFGAVVYEMATGKRAFEGASQASLISAILSSHPPSLSSLQPMTPAPLDRVVRKCLAKEPEKRWQTASDLSDELKWIAQGGSETSRPVIPEAGPAKTPWRWAAVSALVVVVALIAGIAAWLRRPAPAAPQQVSRFSISLAEGERLAASDFPQPGVVISPDGNNLVYAGSRGGATPQLYLRGIGSLDAKPISGTEGASNPFFSPDGRWIAFFMGSALKKVPLAGGVPETVAAVSGVSQPFGATWGPDDTILFSSVFDPRLLRVSAAGGTPSSVTTLDSKNGELQHSWPSFLPGGTSVLYAITTASGSRLVLRDLATGEQRNLGPVGERPTYVPSGHLLYNQEGTLMAVPFDPGRQQVIGSPVAVQEGVWRCGPCNGGAQYSVSEGGTLAYIPGPASSSGERLMVWVGQDGKEEPLPAPARVYNALRISPDGRSIVATATTPNGNGEMFVYDITRQTQARLNPEGANPVWTADGQRVAFQLNSEGKVNLFWAPVDGSSPAERLATSDARQAAGSFSADGQLLAFTQSGSATGSDIWILRLSDRTTIPFLQAPGDQGAPKLSPDGRWLAYVSDESGQREIYVQPYPGPGGKWQISVEGGVEPAWNPNGRELYYRSGDSMLASTITTLPAFAAEKPRVLWEGRYRRAGGNIPLYDVSPDGRRFLMLKPNDPPATQFNVVLNWFEELKQKAPAAQQ
jgi:serine/threonine-protein kinase